MPDPDDALLDVDDRATIASAYAENRDPTIVGELTTVLERLYDQVTGWRYRVALDDPTKAYLADTSQDPLDPEDEGYGEAWITGAELVKIEIE